MNKKKRVLVSYNEEFYYKMLEGKHKLEKETKQFIPMDKYQELVFGFRSKVAKELEKKFEELKKKYNG